MSKTYERLVDGVFRAVNIDYQKDLNLLNEDERGYSILVDEAIAFDPAKNILGGTLPHKYILWRKLFDSMEKEEIVRMFVTNKIQTPKKQFYTQFIDSCKRALNRGIKLQMIIIRVEGSLGAQNYYENLVFADMLRLEYEYNISIYRGNDASVHILNSNRALIGEMQNFETFGIDKYRADLFNINHKSVCNFSNHNATLGLLNIFDEVKSKAVKI